MIKLLTFDNLFLPLYGILTKTRRRSDRRVLCFPAKMTLVHPRALLSIEKISSSS